METNLQNHLDVNIQNNMPPGAYIIRDGKLVPDPNDEAMRIRFNLVVKNKEKVDKGPQGKTDKEENK